MVGLDSSLGWLYVRGRVFRGLSFQGMFGFVLTLLLFSYDMSNCTRMLSGEIMGKMIGSRLNRPLPTMAMMMGNAAGKMAASLSNRCALSGIPTKSALMFSFLKVRARRVMIEGRGHVSIRVGRSTIDVSRMMIMTFNARGGRDVIDSVRAMGPTTLGMPSDGLAATLTKHVSNLVTCRHDNRPKRSGTSFFVHNIAAFNCGGSPLVLVSNVRAASARLTHLRPSSVTTFSVLGSTATATLCNTHNTGNIVRMRAGRNGRKPTGIDLHMRGSFSSGASGVRLTSPVACVRVTGRTMAAHGPLTPLTCSHRGVTGAVTNGGPCLCPTGS